jgi:hypothetical protein
MRMAGGSSSPQLDVKEWPRKDSGRNISNALGDRVPPQPFAHTEQLADGEQHKQKEFAAFCLSHSTSERIVVRKKCDGQRPPLQREGTDRRVP